VLSVGADLAVHACGRGCRAPGGAWSDDAFCGPGGASVSADIGGGSADGATFTALEELALDVLDDLPRDALLARLTRIAPPPAGREKRGVWTTGPLDGARRLEPDGLPTTAQMQMLFDMDAPAWRVMAEKADPL
jgi:hypothetical protein